MDALAFDKEVTDVHHYKETGQMVLGIHIPESDNTLVLDVAGYLFGFPYEHMFVCAGSPEFIGEQATAHYRTIYPDSTMTFIPSKE